jgi:hypothetical protein
MPRCEKRVLGHFAVGAVTLRCHLVIGVESPTAGVWFDGDGVVFAGCPLDFKVMRIQVKKGQFLIKKAGFGAENRAKRGIRGYYLINMLKM